MFRMIALVRLKDDNDVDSVMAAAREMIGREPLIKSGHVGKGLRLFEEYGVPHAHYSVLLDFEDEDSWRTYVANEPHQTFDALAADKVETVVATQYVIPELS
ncbi:MAG: hypothetical protein JWO37_1951 [Acidimicrobiales bacterium]|jgi:hypothetical protein|nr:hypothetical protein [Acidimicrobiales bacterium]